MNFSVKIVAKLILNLNIDYRTNSGVHELKCHDCSKVYIGQTGWSLNRQKMRILCMRTYAVLFIFTLPV
jgi:hypothetical protein